MRRRADTRVGRAKRVFAEKKENRECEEGM